MFFGGMKNLNCGYFWGSSQNWAILGGHFYTFKGVSRYNKSTASTAEYPATAGGTKSYFVRYIMPK